MNLVATLLGAFLLVSATIAQQCQSPKFSDVNSFSTQDAKLNTETSYSVQFRVKCANNAKNLQFFTINDATGHFIVSSSDASGELYQLSWTEPHKSARTGEIKLRVFDEEGFSALKKAQRNNEDIGKVKEIQTLSVTHHGTYKGPVLQTEIFVTILFGAIFFWAQSKRNEIQA